MPSQADQARGGLLQYQGVLCARDRLCRHRGLEFSSAEHCSGNRLSGRRVAGFCFVGNSPLLVTIQCFPPISVSAFLSCSHLPKEHEAMMDSTLEITVNQGEYCLDSRMLARRLGYEHKILLQAIRRHREG